MYSNNIHTVFLINSKVKFAGTTDKNIHNSYDDPSASNRQNYEKVPRTRKLYQDINKNIFFRVYYFISM